VWAMCRHDGLPVSAATVLRLLREEGLLIERDTRPRVGANSWMPPRHLVTPDGRIGRVGC
jgi:hypothetical protein